MSRGRIATLLALAVFGLFGLTTGNLVGYEDETAAISQALVHEGQLRVLSGTPLTAQGLKGRLGHYYSRTGLTQPFLEAPFYWTGEKLDELAANGNSYKWRLVMLRLYNPALAALTVVAILGLLLLRGVRERRALGVASLCAVATLIWPYSKIGMDTTLMAMVALSLLVTAWAVADPSTFRFGLAGTAAALTATSKPYGLLLLVGLVPFFLASIRPLPKLERTRVLVAFAIPMAGGVVAIGWYNWYRWGSPTTFGNTYFSDLVATPIHALGLFLSPGKGLFLYSPVVILGVLGMPGLWRSDRVLALAIILTVAANTIVIAASAQWADETWGPRYIVPTAWLLVLPIAWWAQGRRQIRALALVALLGVCVQIAGVAANYGVAITAGNALAHEPVYAWPPQANPDAIPVAPVAYGDDGPRWIPQASPLLFQIALVSAYVKETVTGSGFLVSYHPFRGTPATLDLEHPERAFGPLPDFWWTFPGRSTKEKLLAVLLALVSLGSAAALTKTQWRPRRHNAS